MKKILEIITEELKYAFEKAGYPCDNVSATVSNRPDLCEYQCNSCMALAKPAHKAPMEIAENVLEFLKNNEKFEDVSAVKPGFINIRVSGEFISGYINYMNESVIFNTKCTDKDGLPAQVRPATGCASGAIQPARTQRSLCADGAVQPDRTQPATDYTGVAETANSANSANAVAAPGVANAQCDYDNARDKASANAQGNDVRADGEKSAEGGDEDCLKAHVKAKTIIVDYGGANVAKPLHIGHLRAAIIGESIKRICCYMGHNAIGDVHLGDWGLQMGQIIAELEERQPDLVYFDDSYKGEYPKEAPFTIAELEEIYPTASKKCKEDEAFAQKAHGATAELQKGKAGYMAIWEHVMRISKEDLKKNYDNLDVHFELWKGESDVQKYIPGMIAKLKSDGITRESEGALVIDVAEETDKKELPPCLIVKSDGASLYATTDMATLLEREELYKPDSVIYVVDKRQSMHFQQVFRAVKKAGIVPEDVFLFHLGFGTMNGKDGQPYKTRQGGVMRLETLINEINDAVYEKMKQNTDIPEEEAKKTSRIIALAALKYGDLSNQATKDYIFDLNKFIEFEGNTGPYILYTIVRIKSILAKAGAYSCRPESIPEAPGSAAFDAACDAACAGSKSAAGTSLDGYVQHSGSTPEITDGAAFNAGVAAPAEGYTLQPAGMQKPDGRQDGWKIAYTGQKSEKALMLELAKFNDVMETAYNELAPHKICSYIYDLSNAFNTFYHEVKILSEPDAAKKNSYLNLLVLTKNILEQCIYLLGFSAPERM